MAEKTCYQWRTNESFEEYGKQRNGLLEACM